MTTSQLLKNLGFALACVVAFGWVFSNAWVTEDAYITFRVIDNFIHGYGLRWNIDERVQVYTHPLWMLLHIPFYALYSNIYYVTIGLSALCGIGAVWLLARIYPLTRWQMLALVILPLCLSPSFRDFVICGLEVPLTLLLLAAFYGAMLRDSSRYGLLTLLAALCVLTRFDNLMLVLPAMLWVLYKNRSRLRIGMLVAASSPVWGWCLFSLFYYGFMFPNTKYAKLGTGVDIWQQLAKGHEYVRHLLFFDSMAFLVIFAGCVAGLYQLSARIVARTFAQPSLLELMLAGLLLQLAYVVAVGGDFMAGRFLVAPFFMALMILLACLQRLPIATSLKLALCGYLMWGAVTDGLRYANLDLSQYERNKGIANERAYYLDNTLFYSTPEGIKIRTESGHFWVKSGKATLTDPNLIDRVVVFYNIGIYGYYAGPTLKIIDTFALSDPLLARLPARKDSRVGHYTRDMPAGYVYARKTSNLSQMDPSLAAYYAVLRHVIAGDLFELSRLKSIIRLNLGYENHLLKEYVAKHPEIVQ